MRGEKEALEFVTGYLIELSLSMDNVFVIALIFGYFQCRRNISIGCCFGNIGRLIMRGHDWRGVQLITLMNFVLYVFGAFLVYSGIKMIFVETESTLKKSVVKLARKLYPVTPQLDGQKFITLWKASVL